MDADQVWQATLGQLQLQMTRATFDTWVKDTRIVSHDGEKLVIGTKSAFAKDWLENRLLTTINRTVTNVLGYAVDIHFIVDTGDDAQDQAPPPFYYKAPSYLTDIPEKVTVMVITVVMDEGIQIV